MSHGKWADKDLRGLPKVILESILHTRLATLAKGESKSLEAPGGRCSCMSMACRPTLFGQQRSTALAGGRLDTVATAIRGPCPTRTISFHSPTLCASAWCLAVSIASRSVQPRRKGTKGGDPKKAGSALAASPPVCGRLGLVGVEAANESRARPRAAVTVADIIVSMSRRGDESPPSPRAITPKADGPPYRSAHLFVVRRDRSP